MIQLKNVSKFYYSKGIISSGISKVNLAFGPREFVVITGESGSGKTTLLNVISGLDSYEEGEMYIDGKETSHFLTSDFEEYRKQYIGNIFQNFNLVNSYTVYQNVELILRINGHSKADISRRVPDIINKVGLSAYSKTKVSKLSGGQKQRVSIARALAKDTDIIVADEPTGNLDSASAEGIVKLLSEISQDKLVIVVTHNYEQFEAYATRRVKMHDGKVVEDEKLAATEPLHSTVKINKPVVKPPTGKISSASKIRLGLRNTFNIKSKFFLLLVVFLFVVLAVSSEYTSLQHKEEEASNTGFNQYFYNYSQDRVVLKKSDGSQFTDDDFRAIKSIDNIRSVAANDIMLDDTVYVEQGDFSYEAIPMPMSEFDGELIEGRMPVNDNEAILTGYKDDYYFADDMIKEIVGKDYKVYIGETKELNIKIVGAAYKEDAKNVRIFSGGVYISDAMMKNLLEESYNYNSKITTIVNGKAQEAVAGSPVFNVVPSEKVVQGSAVLPEESNNFYEKGDAKGKTIKITSENIYYTESVELKVADIYTKKTFEGKTGFKDFEANNGTVFISKADYRQLFAKGNYQSTVYINDTREMKATKEALKDMGYVPLSLRDTIMTYGNELIAVVQVPIAVIIVLALFFIAYFVIRLILKSRLGYFSILRMLGLAKKNIRRILDVELFTVINIAFLIFLAVVATVKFGVIDVEYIRTLIEYLKFADYVILYAILMMMGYLISGKFVRSLFKKSAMGSYREED